VLPANDPLVVASGENLREFCQAFGVPLEKPSPAAPAVITERHEADARREQETAVQEPVAARIEPRRRLFGVTAAVVLTGVALAGVMWLRSGAPPSSQSDAQPEPAAAQPTPAPTLDAARPPEPPPAPEPAPPSTIEKESSAPTPAPAPAAAVSVVTAQLCRAFSNWQCTAAVSPTDATQLFFYTRLRSPADTTVEHRWYYDGRLLRTVPLRIRANQAEGYRTYSRNTVSGERAGSWRVELRTQDGTVLHEEQVEVER
jgi:hypothetical protein